VKEYCTRGGHRGPWHGNGQRTRLRCSLVGVSTLPILEGLDIEVDSTQYVTCRNDQNENAKTNDSYQAAKAHAMGMVAHYVFRPRSRPP